MLDDANGPTIATSAEVTQFSKGILPKPPGLGIVVIRREVKSVAARQRNKAGMRAWICVCKVVAFCNDACGLALIEFALRLRLCVKAFAEIAMPSKETETSSLVVPGQKGSI